MARRVLIINGHPDPRPERLCAALADAYAAGARSTGREVRRIGVGALDIPLLRTAEAFEHGELPPAIAGAQDSIRWADHLVIIHPLWQGAAPAMLKGFIEQTFRYGFGTAAGGRGFPAPLLKGRSARIIVTMGMPALAYRWLFGAFGVRGLERGVLWLCGFRPVRRTLLGGVETASAAQRTAWLREVERLGERGA